MEAYKPELDRAAAYLRTVPGRVNEANIKKIGTQNHLEVFEDEIANGKRLSLSGSIVVIDIDFVDGRVSAVNVALASSIPADDTYSFMASANEPDKHILASLSEPRLDKFAHILEFIARCDRFSTKEVDFFRALDSMSRAIYKYEAENADANQFGKLHVNPGLHLGLGLWYHGPATSKKYAMLDVMPGSRPEYSVRYESDWLTDDVKWKSIPANDPSVDSRAELALTLDPPLVVSEKLAVSLNAAIVNEHPPLNNRLNGFSYSMKRHPSQGSVSDDYELTVANMLPYRLVTIDQIPLEGPSKIPGILSRLRQFAQLEDFYHSLTVAPGTGTGNANSNLAVREIAVDSDVAADMSVADALELVDKPPAPSKHIITAVELQRLPSSDDSEAVCITVFSHGSNDPGLKLFVEEGGSVRIDNADAIQGIGETLTKLLNSGHLAHAISYVHGNWASDSVSTEQNAPKKPASPDHVMVVD